MSNEGMAALRKWQEENPDHETVVKTPWEKLREKNTRKTAVDAMCHHCMGWDEDGARPDGVRADIRECTSKRCPLYNWRPFK